MDESLAGELLKIINNKVLARYLYETSQFMQADPVTNTIFFTENRVLKPNYNQDKSWDILKQPTIEHHPAQHRSLSEVRLT